MSKIDHMQACRDALTLCNDALRCEDWEIAESAAQALAQQARLVRLTERQEQQESAGVPF